jgi:hypothetical protein
MQRQGGGSKQAGGGNQQAGGGNQQAGGGCGCGMPLTGGGGGLMFANGGYRKTARNRKYLKKFRAGQSIGFTMLASLKAKGLIPRTSRKNRGRKVLGPKYKTRRNRR